MHAAAPGRGMLCFCAHFQQLNDLQKDDGVALLHTIDRTRAPATTNTWLRRYIFPRGYTRPCRSCQRRSNPPL